jgi:hypothetical protein
MAKRRFARRVPLAGRSGSIVWNIRVSRDLGGRGEDGKSHGAMQTAGFHADCLGQFAIGDPESTTAGGPTR